MKKAFNRKKKEKWRPSLNGSEDTLEGSQTPNTSRSMRNVSHCCYVFYSYLILHAYFYFYS